MSERPPANPEPPSPPGEDVDAPDMELDAPDDREVPDGTAVHPAAGTEEAPD